jgi:hypothetical protein
MITHTAARAANIYKTRTPRGGIPSDISRPGLRDESAAPMQKKSSRLRPDPTGRQNQDWTFTGQQSHHGQESLVL